MFYEVLKGSENKGNFGSKDEAIRIAKEIGGKVKEWYFDEDESSDELFKGGEVIFPEK